MYRTAFRSGRRLYASKPWKTVQSDFPVRSRTIGASVLLARPSSSASQKFSLSQIAPPTDAFSLRHIGPDAAEEKEMLRTLNLQVKIPQRNLVLFSLVLPSCLLQHLLNFVLFS